MYPGGVAEDADIGRELVRVGLPLFLVGLLLIGAAAGADTLGLISAEPASILRSDRDPSPPGGLADLAVLGQVSVADGTLRVERSLERLSEAQEVQTVRATVTVPLSALDTLVYAERGSNSLKSQDGWSLQVFCAAQQACATEAWPGREARVPTASLGIIRGRESAQRAVSTLSALIAEGGGTSGLSSEKPIRYHARQYRAAAPH